MGGYELRFWCAVRVLMAAAIFILIITTSVRLAAGSNLLYEALFSRHNVSALTGISEPDLLVVAEQVQEYLQGQRLHLNVEMPVFGHLTPLFTTLERSHMDDVRKLFLLTYQFQFYSVLLLLLVIITAAIRLRRRACFTIQAAAGKLCNQLAS